MLRVLYININRQIYTLEVEKVGTVYNVQFDEKNFIIGLILDGKRVNSQSVTPLENYHCSLTGHLMTVEDRDFANEGRLISIDESLFFFLVKEQVLQGLQSVLDNGFQAQSPNGLNSVYLNAILDGYPLFYLQFAENGYSMYRDLSAQSSSLSIDGPYGTFETFADSDGSFGTTKTNKYLGIRYLKHVIVHPDEHLYNCTVNLKHPANQTKAETYIHPLTIQGKKADSNCDVQIWASVPLTATSLGVLGQIAYDLDYVYVCISTNVWKRSPLTTW